MEASNSLLSSPSSLFPPRAQLKRFPSTSALEFHEQTVPAFNSSLVTSLPQQFPTSVLIQDDIKPLLQITKEYKTSDVTFDGPPDEQNGAADFDLYLKEFQNQLLRWPGLGLLSSQIRTVPSFPYKTEKHVSVEVEACDVIALAKIALSASKEAVLLAEDYKSSGSANLDDFPEEKEKIVRSARHLERISKRRGVAKRTIVHHEENIPSDLRRKSKASDPNDPLGLFYSVPETKQLLTPKEEAKLIVHIQELMALEEVKGRLCSQFGREPTLVEWAEAVGLCCHDLQSQIHCGNCSRDKLIYANFRMVTHIAKKYQGQGLSIQDLLQAGNMGLIKSIQKFKPQPGCRFSSYAYWWIRQSVKKAIFRHCRLIRLPDNVYSILSKITEAKRSCRHDGYCNPTKDEIAARVGITVERLEMVQIAARLPLSMHHSVWADQNTTFEHIMADPSVEALDVSVVKDMMRCHIRGILNLLSPKERNIMRLRYGIKGSKRTTLSDIGVILGLSKERTRQIESIALYKLRQCVDSQGLDAYADLVS